MELNGGESKLLKRVWNS